MKTMRASLANSQRGSMYTTLILVAMVGIFILAALKIIPTYIDNNIIVNAMEGMVANDELKDKNIAEIRSSLMRTLNTNNVDNFDPNNVVLVREDDREYIDINYEARAPLFYNIEAVVVFTNRFEKR
jgi:hypothetical protein